jgi:hypothetical protein
MIRSSKYLLLILILLLLTWVAAAEEGMWMPHQIKELGLNSKGLKIPWTKIYNEDGTGLINAIVRVRTGTGSFVSKNGLILTNHHVAFRAIQQSSDKDHDYITHGFMARTTAEEIPAPGYYINVFLGYEDVTSSVLKYIKPNMTSEQKSKILERIKKILVAKAEKEGKDLYCTIDSMYGGNRYYLFRFKQLHDVRIVYAPPLSIGKYGGDIDNWIWPRHTGDFTFLRAYVSKDNLGVDYSPENIPYQPDAYLKISIAGVEPGDFTFIMGFPGKTYREFTLQELQFEIQQMKQKVHSYKNIIDFWEQVGKDDRTIQIKYASKVYGLNNGLKYRIAALEGIQKQSIIERKGNIEKKFLQWVQQDPQRTKKYGMILSQIEKFILEDRDFYMKYQGLSNLTSPYISPALLHQAYQIYRTVTEQQKPDIKREKNFQEKDLPNIKSMIQNAEKSYHPDTDRAYFKFLLNQMLTVDSVLVAKAFLPILQEGEKGIEKYVDKFYASRLLTDPEKRMNLLQLKPSTLIGLNDPIINLAVELEKELSLLRERKKVLDFQKQHLKKIYLAGILEMYQGIIAPDANSTIRFSYGPVKDYLPRDGVIFQAQTTLTGVMEKETGSFPFEVPEKLKQLYHNRDFGKYIDKNLDDIPTCFLNVTDSTGGNSGSPVLDANGAIVGLLFDGTYESVAGDYFVVPEFQRVINVDIRYVLFVTDKFANGRHLIDELGL